MMSFMFRDRIETEFDYGSTFDAPHTCYLMYAGTVLAVANDPNDLLPLKAECVFKGSVRYPEMLSITIDGESWVFDVKFDKKSALRYLSGE